MKQKSPLLPFVFLGCMLIIALLTDAWQSVSKAQQPEQYLNHVGNPAVFPLPEAPPDDPPFSLPFAVPSGPGTWYVSQGFGNTAEAFVIKDIFYLAGQGLHFGIDFDAPCGTEITAIGDGIVAEVDNHGSAPHSLMIDHANGYSSFYGHLLERPNFQTGDIVAQGDIIAQVGDLFETCRTAPHLHLEIRSNFHDLAYNPILFIDADWDSLALLGGLEEGFQRDLANPHLWQHANDQPTVTFGSEILNAYTETWPPPPGAGSTP